LLVLANSFAQTKTPARKTALAAVSPIQTDVTISIIVETSAYPIIEIQPTVSPNPKATIAGAKIRRTKVVTTGAIAV
jgi:hypothetical protein